MPEEQDDFLLHAAAKFQNPKLKNLNCSEPNFHLQWRKNSPDELDVFDANTYFSTDDITNLHLPFSLAAATTNPIPPLHLSSSKIRRQSLDSSKLMNAAKQTNLLNIRSTNSINSADYYVDRSSEKKTLIKSPTSPGQKLSTFLSSLFSHSPNTHNDKKAKTKTKTTIKKQMNQKLHKDATISRSSTNSNSTSAAAARSFTATSRSSTNSNSHFQIEKDPKSMISGFRTPPPYYTSKSKIQTELHDDLYEINDLGHLRNRSSSRSKSVNFVPSYSSGGDSRHVTVAWLQQRFTNGFWRNQLSSVGDTTNIEKVSKDQADQDKSVLKVIKRSSAGSLMADQDDGFESDSSSDLFELQSFRCSSGLPVYEGTDLGKIMKQRNHSS